MPTENGKRPKQDFNPQPLIDSQRLRAIGQRELAAGMKRARPTVSKLLNGRSRGIADLRQLAKLLGKHLVIEFEDMKSRKTP